MKVQELRRMTWKENAVKRQNLVPIIGILALLLCTGISAKKEKQDNLSKASALPTVLSETQTMSIDEIYARFRSALSKEGSSSYSLDMDKDAHTITLTRYDSYFSVDAVNAALSNKKYLDKWNSALAQLADLCNDMQNQVTNHGHPEYSVNIRVLNRDDFGQLFAMIERGVVTYDIVDSMPPGERLD